MQTHTAKKIAQNTVIQIGGKILATLLGILTVAAFTRLLGTDGYGQLTVILTFLTLFAVVVDFGLTVTTVQMISEQQADEERIVGNLLALRVCSAVVFLALAPIISLAFPYEPIVHIGIAIGTVAYLFGTTSQMLVGIFQKRLIMSRVVLAELLNRSLVFVGALIAPLLGFGLTEIVWLLVLGNAMQLATILLFTRKHVRLSFRWQLASWVRILKRSWPIGLSLVFNLLYLRGDVLFLSIWRSDAEIGIYGFAYKIVDVMTALPVMYMGLVLPVLVAAWSKKSNTFNTTMQTAFDVFSVIAVPLSLGSIAIGVPLMEFIGGENFSASGKVLAIFGSVITLVFFGSLFSHAIIALKKQLVMTWGYLAVAIVTVVGYVLFIPQYGIWAAAWLTLLAEALITLATAFVVWRTSAFVPNGKMFARSATATLFMFLVLLILPDLHVLLDLAIAVCVYYVVLSAIGGPKIRDVANVFLPEKPPVNI